MKFRNTNALFPLNFTIRGKEYSCDAGGEVEIDPAHISFVVSRGLTLEVAPPDPEPIPEPVIAPAPEPVLEPEAPVKAYASTKRKVRDPFVSRVP